jgi:hypothetical protein
MEIEKFQRSREKMKLENVTSEIQIKRKKFIDSL